MARLPDAGYRPVDLAAGRPVARFDASPIAQGEAASAQVLGRSGEALARALREGGDALAQAIAAQGRTGQAIAAAGLELGQRYQAAGGAQGRTIEQVGERAGRATRQAGEDLGGALMRGGEKLAKAEANAAAQDAHGLRNFAAGLADIGTAARAIKAANDRMDFSRATSGFINDKSRLDAGIAKDQDYKSLPDRYGRELDKLRDKWLETIRDANVRAQFTRDVDTHTLRGVLAAQRQAFALEREDERARLFADLEQLRDNARTAAEDERGAIIGAGHARIATGLEKGYLTPGEARALRTKWTHDYAIAWSQGRPLGQQAAILKDSLDGRHTSTPVDFLPRSKVADLHKQASAEILAERRRVESETALERRRVANQVNDDLHFLAATGRGVTGLDPATVERVLGPTAALDWQAARDDAHTVWTNAHDLSTLPEPEIAARLDALQQDAKNSDRQQAIHAAVEKRAELIRRLRREDPARSVADDPSVRAAAQALDDRHPEAFQALAEARLAAQERAGVPDHLRSVIARDEALRLIEPLVRARPEEEQDIRNATARQFRAMFGRHADAAFAAALRVRGMDAQ
jgi:hypothetical protein